MGKLSNIRLPNTLILIPIVVCIGMANYSNPFNTSVGRNKIVIDENYFGSKPGPKLKEFIFDDTIITEDINTNVDGNWGILQNLTPIV